jgi:integrase
MARVDLPYLWAAKGRGGRLYWFYRRNGLRVPITSPDGCRLSPGDPGFVAAYDRIHESFESPRRDQPAIGTVAHIVDDFLVSPEFRQLSKNTKRNYRRKANWLKEHHGKRSFYDMPREAILGMRNEFQDTPSEANLLVKVVGRVLIHLEDHPIKFHLPKRWQNPLRRRIKPLKGGSGHKPWEEFEIVEFREEWPSVVRERVAFEVYLNSGQRTVDVVKMLRTHHRNGEIYVGQTKTGEEVWIPVLDDLKPVLDAWLASLPVDEPYIFPSRKGGHISTDQMQGVMRVAMIAAGLPNARTLHGLRYTFAVRAIEFGIDHSSIEAIVGHQTFEMAIKYTEKRRKARFVAMKLNEGLREQAGLGHASRHQLASECQSENRPAKS